MSGLISGLKLPREAIHSSLTIGCYARIGMTSKQTGRTIPGDWHPGVIPANAVIDDTAHVETSYSFLLCRSEVPEGIRIGRGASVYLSTMFDLGFNGRVRIGDFALLNGPRIMCDQEIEIGDYSLIAWNVVLMDNYRVPFDVSDRRRFLELLPSLAVRNWKRESAAADKSRIECQKKSVLNTYSIGRSDADFGFWKSDFGPRPIRIGRNVWIGFDVCVLPGVNIGDGAVVGARSVITDDVPPFTVVAGNPARLIRQLERPERWPA